MAVGQFVGQVCWCGAWGTLNDPEFCEWRGEAPGQYTCQKLETLEGGQSSRPARHHMVRLGSGRLGYRTHALLGAVTALIMARSKGMSGSKEH